MFNIKRGKKYYNFIFIDTIERYRMSNKYTLMKNVSNKCADDKLHPKMKTNGTLMCGCGTGKEFDYDPNIFDCRLFGLFLRKSENSHNKYKGLLQKLNILESAIFENKESGDVQEIQNKVNEIINQFNNINIASDTRQFIIEYMSDKSKKRDDFNRYQVMSTLQSTINFIEYVNNPKLADVLLAVSQWVTESKKIIEGRSVSSSDISGIIGKQGEQIIREDTTRYKNMEEGLIAKQTAEKPYPNTSEGEDNFKRHKGVINKLINIANVFSKIFPEYFSVLMDELEMKRKVFETIRDEQIYRSYYRPLLYNDNNKDRPIFDIFRKLNEKLSSIRKGDSTEESKVIKDILSSVFIYYQNNISEFRRHEKRFEFISYLYSYILLSSKIRDNREYQLLYNDDRIGKKNDFITKKVLFKNIEKILKGQINQYRDNEKSGKIGLDNENKTFPLLENVFKTIEEEGVFKENDELLENLVNGINGSEKYIRFEPPEIRTTSSYD